MMNPKNQALHHFQTQRHRHESKPLRGVLRFLECRQVTTHSETGNLLRSSWKSNRCRGESLPARNLSRIYLHHEHPAILLRVAEVASDIHPLEASRRGSL